MREGGRPTGARDAEVEREEKEGRGRHVEDAADTESDHSDEGKTFGTKDVVEREGGRHEGSGKEHGLCVGDGVRKNRVGCAHSCEKTIESRKRRDGKEGAEKKRSEECRARRRMGSRVAFGTEKAGGLRGTALSHHDAQGLDHHWSAKATPMAPTAEVPR